MSITDEIKERLDIVEVISAYVPLKKAGRNYKGLCPFHNEKTPSFVVFPDSQSWHCFGACNTGGDVFSFIMKRENLDFGEALQLLAARAGVTLQPRPAASEEEEKQLERLRALVADAAIYFHYLLKKAPEAEIARAYLTNRGLLPATWEAWQLGYALDSWDALQDHLVGRGYTLAEIEEAGLIIAREHGPGYYDRFRGRLMIPIRDVQGRVIGFGARILREDADRPQPKYINSPQTPLFDKGSVLFGLDMARKAIRDADLAVIVEGYMDVLMSHQVGVTNVVAGMGTALTESQLRLLKRYTSNITLALDPDKAGDQAALRGLETARQTLEREWEPVFSPSGLLRQESRLKAQLRIAALPEGLDPDELARRDPERWRQVINDARPIVDYYLALVSRQEDLGTARGKANAVERLAPLIREVANPVERSHYMQLLARLVQTDERVVARQIAALGRSSKRTASPQGGIAPVEEEQPRPAYGLEEHILGCLLARPDLLPKLDGEMLSYQTPPLSPEDFTRAENRAALAFLQGLPLAGEEWSEDALFDAMPAALREHCLAVLAQTQRNPALSDERLIKDLGDSLLRLRARNLEQQITRIRFLILDSQESGVPDETLRQYYEIVATCSAQKRHIGRILNARSLSGAAAMLIGQPMRVVERPAGSTGPSMPTIERVE